MTNHRSPLFPKNQLLTIVLRQLMTVHQQITDPCCFLQPIIDQHCFPTINHSSPLLPNNQSQFTIAFLTTNHCTTLFPNKLINNHQFSQVCYFLHFFIYRSFLNHVIISMWSSCDCSFREQLSTAKRRGRGIKIHCWVKVTSLSWPTRIRPNETKMQSYLKWHKGHNFTLCNEAWLN